ncbi:MAG: acyl carrier protein [Acidimicrobiia bacterium]|nr:acyl carrier protein [Acidimicrobiia bacterium]
MSDENFARFVKVAVDVLSVEADKVTMEASFADDLDADSLDLVELVMGLEEEFDVSVDEDELEGVETVKGAYELVTNKL